MTYSKPLSILGLLMLSTVALADPVRVLIDPGHGGSNTGAPGRGGAYEKQVTLQIARRLAERLKAQGAEVALTREKDRYLTLRQRSRRANVARPTCFISLHANASPDHARHGVETYVLAREAVDVDARRVAARAPDDVRAIVAELSHLETQRRALELARAVQGRLVEADAALGERGVDRGVKQAGYDVLSGVEVPAILVEVGFIDHPIEGVSLTRPETQRLLAEKLAAGIMDFAAHRPRGLPLAQLAAITSR